LPQVVQRLAGAVAQLQETEVDFVAVDFVAAILGQEAHQAAEVSQEAEVNQVAEVQLQILQVVEQLLLTVLLQAQEPIWPMLQDIQDMMDYSIH
jgi:hypothetical protein